MPKSKKPTHTTVKVPTGAYDLAQKLLKLAANGGWQSLGIDRSDVPTLGALLEEGLKKLEPARKLAYDVAVDVAAAK